MRSFLPALNHVVRALQALYKALDFYLFSHTSLSLLFSLPSLPSLPQHACLGFPHLGDVVALVIYSDFSRAKGSSSSAFGYLISMLSVLSPGLY